MAILYTSLCIIVPILSIVGSISVIIGPITSMRESITLVLNKTHNDNISPKTIINNAVNLNDLLSTLTYVNMIAANIIIIPKKGKIIKLFISTKI
jgi:hypothetical protein